MVLVALDVRLDELRRHDLHAMSGSNHGNNANMDAFWRVVYQRCRRSAELT
jgi:hypothetical protein